MILVDPNRGTSIYASVSMDWLNTATPFEDFKAFRHTVQMIRSGRQNYNTASVYQRLEIEITIQSEAGFYMDEERRTLYKNFNRNDESQHLSHGHRKVPTIYTFPCFRNQVVIHLLSDLSAKPKDCI